jgi:adenine-specific DNA-methyltransferase
MEQATTDERTETDELEDRRIAVTKAIDRKHRSKFGQFFTPAAVARYMASLLEFEKGEEATLLDPGAGIASLTAAVARRAQHTRIRATCYEIEESFRSEMRVTLMDLPNIVGRIESGDFIEHAVELVARAIAMRS